MSLLGEGTYGKVVKARKDNSNEIYAIKEFNDISRGAIELQLEILREVKILKEMNHENIVKVIEFYFINNGISSK